MKHNPTNITYTAADIQQYLAGKMTPTEMNALEKAALDDPFLQEAIEGYEAVPAESWKPILNDLKQGFAAPAANNDTAKVVGFGHKRFSWIKYAAAVLILGVGFGTIYIINQNRANHTEETAVANNEKNNVPTLKDAAVTPKADSSEVVATTAPPATNNTFANVTTENTPAAGTVTFKDKLKQATDTNGYAVYDINKAITNTEKFSDVKTVEVAVPAESKAYSPISPVPAAAKPTPRAAAAPMAEEVSSDYTTAKKKEVTARDDSEYRNSVGRNQNARFYNQQTLNTNQGMLSNNAPNEVNRNFVAQVVDDNNNPLPFANINVKNEGFGTYADAKGNVRLISTDSIIPIEVKSLGFESRTVVLRSTQQPATIQLREDADIAYQEKTTDRKQANNNVMSRRAYLQKDAEQNAEPADGWEKYDTYISNNLVIPDDLVKKNVHGEVALSFDVQKNGAITNIKVDKSLCTDCDEIAKRIVAQGPQWKVKKGKKAKARVTVHF